MDDEFEDASSDWQAIARHQLEDKYRAVLDKIEGCWSRLRGEPPQRLYHYASADALLGILEKNELWASDLRFLNDSSEFEYGFELMQAIASEEAIDKTHSKFWSEATDLVLFHRVCQAISSGVQPRKVHAETRATPRYLQQGTAKGVISQHCAAASYFGSRDPRS